ncbi:helix-turn-helix domain-containing protein [Pelagibacterium montanilacus]|uniref:helix-turn-helix domain-containing protein n=1 Tax=Pelagibacterium montanilacus TaxID=2185280 RepID=UPI00248261F9|nr:helix-turn-helix domain-containing protein [Pelagibacterium montanilacus]
MQEPFHASVGALTLGPLMLARTRSTGQYWRRSPWKIARDGLDHYMIQLYLGGTQTCDWGGGSLEMPKGGPLVYDLACAMRATSSAFDNLSLVIPRALLGPLLQFPDAHHMRALPAQAPLVGLLREHLILFDASQNSIDLPQVRDLATSVVHLVAACLNAETEERAIPPEQIASSQLMRARRLIEAGLWDKDLGPTRLAGQLGVSRSRLYEIFSPLGGVKGVIRDRRLAAALTLLTDPATQHLSVRQIADRCLFSPTELSRAFRARYGVSPRTARHYGLADDNGFDPQADSLDRTYERWIRQLSNLFLSPDGLQTEPGQSAHSGAS